MQKIAKEILEEYANAYSDLEVKSLSDKLTEIKNIGANEVLEKLKGLLEGYVHTKENISLYEYYKKQYGINKEL